MRLLRSTDDSIAGIAIAAGFADQSHLCRIFRALAGYAPSTHRRRIQGRNDA
ncbi:MAG TPA: helix-turn-helix domain-containing protein [Thermoanaerobaculia bacterium]|nr:helix-turn-helix domain-containing protein [Thermoanaerobaculia bacterium]